LHGRFPEHRVIDFYTFIPAALLNRVPLLFVHCL
jgi:hypothetical protein